MTEINSMKEAESMVGGLSAPSKMPSYAWSISAKRCGIGSTLAKVKGIGGGITGRKTYGYDRSRIDGAMIRRKRGN